jgi:hypothetical protein
LAVTAIFDAWMAALIVKDDIMTTFQQACRQIIYQMYVTVAQQAKSRLSFSKSGKCKGTAMGVRQIASKVRPVDPSTFNCLNLPNLMIRSLNVHDDA